MPPTQKDIAHRLGVSQGLISQVLLGKKQVRPEVHRQILQECRKAGYLPNHAAAALRTGRRHTWGVVFPSFSFLADFNRQIIQGLWEVAHEHHQSLSINCLESPPSEAAYMRMIREGRFDGLFLIYEGKKIHATIPFEEIDRLGVATVVVNCPLPDQKTNFIFSDGEEGVYQAVRHLIEVHGRRKIGYVFRDQDSWLMENRYAGYVRALSEFNLPVEEPLVQPLDPEKGYDQNGKRAVAQWLREGIEFDAVYCPADYIAFGVVAALQEAGIRVGEKVSVGGFDNFHLSESLWPGLTTVACDGVAMGRKAAGMMLEALEQKKESPPQGFKVPVSLVVRQSCGCRTAEK
jgi:DNA-binding LacI/PurR family transcriptional regulator